MWSEMFLAEGGVTSVLEDEQGSVWHTGANRDESPSSG